MSRIAVNKVILVGQSWGSLLGVHVIKRKPELFYAFVGTGQVVSLTATAAAQAQWAKQQAIANNDQATLKALDNAEAVPAPMKSLALSDAAQKYLMLTADDSYRKMIIDFIGPKPRPTQGDVADWIAGTDFTGPKLRPVILGADLRTLGLDMPIPFFVIQGQDDHLASFDVAKAYVADIGATKKGFIPIDGGHYACFTNADQFIDAMRKYIRPLAT